MIIAQNPDNVNGSKKLEECIDAMKLHASKGIKITLGVLAGLLIVFGIVLIANPFASMAALLTAIGAGLVFGGITDVASLIFMARSKSKENK